MKSLPLLILCCLACPLFGQQTVSVPILVDAGQANISLKNTDLKAEVDGKPVAILSIASVAGQHLQYALLNDQSEKTRWPNGNKQQTELASRFLKQVVVAGTDMGTLVNFGEYVFLDVQNEKDPQKLAAKLEPVGNVHQTQLYDAVVSGTRWLAKQRLIPAARKVVFLFSDGKDDVSKSNLQQAIEALQTARIPIFVVAPSSVEKKRAGEALRELASNSGGRVHFLPRDTRQTSLDVVKRDLDQEYLLTLNVSSFQSGKLRLIVNQTTNPQISVVAPSRIIVQ